MELLIIKSNNQYIRFKDKDYHLVNLDKASVFPMDQLESVRTHAAAVRDRGMDASIKRLVLTEEDFES